MAKGTVNKVILIGRLGQDPELKYTPSGSAVTTLSIATTEVWKDKDGNTQERAEWHRLVMWNKLAETAAEYLKKGHRAYFEGRLQTRSWEDNSGVKRYTTEVVVSQMQFLNSKSDSSGFPPPPTDEDHLGNQPTGNQAGQQDQEASGQASEDDLPF